MTDDVRDRSHRLNRTVGIARHGRLPHRNPIATAGAVLAGVIAVAVASSMSIVAIAAGQVSSDIGDGVVIQGQGSQARPGAANRVELGALEGGFTMLVVGTDNDPAQGEQYGERDATLNDVNILVHVSADHTNATAVSIPRDLVVPIPSCPRPDGSGSSPAMSAQPINNAYSYGGLNCVVQTVQQLTGLDVQFSATVSFDGVIQMSNAVGGVPVCVAQPITDRWTGLDLPKGTSTLEGAQALAFLRSRHGVGDGSDLGRISSQQVFLSSLLRTVTSDDTLGSLPRLYALARAAARNMTLSESLASVPTMVRIGSALKDVPLDHVNFVQYPGSTGGTGVYAGKVQPDAALAGELFARVKADQSFSLAAGSTGIGSATAPITAPAAPSTTAPRAPSTTAPTLPSTTAAPSPGATSSTIAGLQGQSADEQTCTVAFHG